MTNTSSFFHGRNLVWQTRQERHEPRRLTFVYTTIYNIIMGGTSNSTANYGEWAQGLTQNDLMEKDTVLVLDDADNVTGSASKKESHVFSSSQPRAILHRAFSVFLFDKSDGRLLLQQRASTKITFPNVRG